MDDAARMYLATLTHGIPDNLFTYIWTKTPDGVTPKKTRTTCFAGHDGKVIDAMVKLAHDAAPTYDVYFGMGIADKKLPTYQRLQRDSRPAAGIMALWHDIDFGTDGHKTNRLPADEDEAFGMLEDVFAKFPPSMAVHSGGGFHVYWMLEEPLLTGGAVDPRELVRRWNNYIQSAARRAGYAIDSMKDIERVLRIPGTLNHKPDYGQPREARLIVHDETRYTAATLWEACESYSAGLVESKDTKPKNAAPTPITGDLVVDARRGVNGKKFSVLFANNPRFRKTWEHARPDIDASLDSSSSVYEMAIMGFAVNAGWNDQEIVDLVTAWRDSQNEEPVEKPLHYFQFSLGRARSERFNAEDNLPPPPIDGNGTSGEDGGDMEARRDALSRLLGISRAGNRIRRIVRYDGKEAFFRMETERGYIEMGGAGNMADFPSCQRRLFAAGYNVIATRDQWLMVKDLMIALTVAEEIAEVSTIGLVMGLVEEYLAKRPTMETPQEGEESRDPFWLDGARSFFLRSFVEWCGINAPYEKLSSADIATALKSGGAESAVIHVKDGNMKKTTRNVWRVPTSTKVTHNESESELSA